MKKLLLLNLTLALMVACGAATPASTLPPPPDAGPVPTTTAVPPADLTPAQLAWVLSEVRIGDDARPPGGVDVPTLRAYLGDLVTRLTALARP